METIQTGEGIRRMFSSVYRRYRLINHLLTLGLDILWRRKAALIAGGVRGGNWLDICSGTGDMAAGLSGVSPEGTDIYGVDFSLPMLLTARKDPRTSDVDFVLADARELPFAPESFDLVTISFSTRNMNLSREILTDTFRGFLRVLKPGGVLINLETSQPPSAVIRALFHLLVKIYVAPAGRLISGAGPAYRYLSGSIPRFYPAEQLRKIIQEAGFRDVSFRRMTMGAVALHRAVRPGG